MNAPLPSPSTAADQDRRESGARHYHAAMATSVVASGKSAAGLDPQPPGWIDRLLGESAQGRIVSDAHGLVTTLFEGTGWSLVHAHLFDALAHDALTFQRKTVEAYESIADSLRGAEASHPVRFWNFIPRIRERIDERLDRYMLFNAGRFAAYLSWYGGRRGWARHVATASGVGHDGRDLIVYCLAAAQPGAAVENPRQVPAYQYSQRYGPMPPSFSRATVVSERDRNRRLILVGGTASIRGEHSAHADALEQQIGETLENLAFIIRAALGDESAIGQHLNGDLDRWLSHLAEVRVYYVDEGQRSMIEQRVLAHLAPAAPVEWRQADLCRRELLVEIEGVVVQPLRQLESA